MLELADDLGQLCEVPGWAQINHTTVQIGTQDLSKRRQGEHLVKQSSEGVVGWMLQAEVAAAVSLNEIAEFVVTWFGEVFVGDDNARDEVLGEVIAEPKILILFKVADKVGEHEEQAPQCEFDLEAVEKHPRSG